MPFGASSEGIFVISASIPLFAKQRSFNCEVVAKTFSKKNHHRNGEATCGFFQIQPYSSDISSFSSMARTFILWLHGLGDSGPANEPIKREFKSPELRDARWLFPSAPFNPVSCNNGRVMPSWFDVPELPFKAGSPINESSVLEAVKTVHAIIDQEIAEGTNPENVFVCGLSQGGALTLASVLLYPKTLGGGAVLSGWVPFTSSVISQFPQEAKKTPILWSHGTEDRMVLFEAGQAALPFLKEAGVTYEFKSYRGLGHSISNKELRYIESWIKRRLKSSSTTCLHLNCLRRQEDR